MIADDAWACRWLNAGEADLFKRMKARDRRRAVLRAHRVADALGNADGVGVPKVVLAAALMQEVGEIESRVSKAGRAAARLPVTRASAVHPGWRRRLELHRRHQSIGESMLLQVGSDPLVVAWAGQHHELPERRTVDPETARVLDAAQ